MSTQHTYRGEQNLDVGGLSLTLTFEVDADITYEPAKLGGPPDRCSPGFSELEITERRLVEVRDEDGNIVAFHPGTEHRLLAALNWDSVEDLIWEDFHAHEGDARADEPEPED